VAALRGHRPFSTPPDLELDLFDALFELGYLTACIDEALPTPCLL
jgi:hypothetical protein